MCFKEEFGVKGLLGKKWMNMKADREGEKKLKGAENWVDWKENRQ